jgi:hypothetical protein
MNSAMKGRKDTLLSDSSMRPRRSLALAFLTFAFLSLTPTLTCAQIESSQVLPGCSQPLATRVAVYDFVAYIAYRDFQRAKYEDSTTAARALEFIWDATSGCMEHFGVKADETQKIDELMDLFVKPLESDSSKADPKTVGGAYARFIQELKVAEASAAPKK